MISERTLTRNIALRAAGLPSLLRAPVGPVPRDVPVPVARGRAGAPCLALIATRNFMPFAKLTARTFLQHHPEFEAYLLLVDGDASDRASFTEGHVVLLSELDAAHPGWFAAKFTASEFANALKPTFLRHLSAFADQVVYLDCDIAVFSRLTEMLDLLQTSDLVLVPHMLAPPPRPEQFGVHPNRTDIFNSGLINAGSFAIALSRTGAFLSFWEQANFAPGTFYREEGYQTDQQYLNWALVTVPGASVLRSTRYNVAYWNLHDRDMRVEAGGFMVDGKPLAYFHFSGYNVYEPLHLSVHDGRHSVYHHPAVAEILTWYSDQVLGCPTVGLMHEPYPFDVLANGLPLNPFLRDILKKYEIYFPRFDTRTQAGADGLCGFLLDVLPVTASMLPLVAAEIYDRRPDLQRGFPQAHTEAVPEGFRNWFFRHAGFEFGIQGLIDRFRRVLLSDSVAGIAEQVTERLGEAAGRFLGDDRLRAAGLLEALGDIDLAVWLAECRAEWSAQTDVLAALDIYQKRPDLQIAFPDPLGEHHEGYCHWLSHYAPDEYGCAAHTGDRLARCSATAVLARIFSFLARREDIARDSQETLLEDDPSRVLRHLIRAAGDGLEHDLDDVVVLRFIHQTRRDLLVPLYLELPLVRMRPHASRLPEANLRMLPEPLRHAEWARRGCEAHAAGFDRFEACLDEEMRRQSRAATPLPREVIGYLRTHQREEPALRTAERACRAVLRHLPPAAAGAPLHTRIAERVRQPGVNVLGYFHSDIGVGESTRGLAQAIACLRPVNRVPLTTSQMQDGTTLPDLFQRYDYLTDTNVFVSYPHKQEDLMAMMRPEQLAGRRNVAHLAWEQADANPWWKIVYDRYDEIWTISGFAATAFRKMFPGRVRVVPNVLDFSHFPAAPPRAVEREVLKFVFVFDANSSMERKNPEGTLDAFIAAFAGTPDASRVQLTMKVGGMHRPEHVLRMEGLRRKAAVSGLQIAFDGRQLDRESMLRFIADADCYVSLHRAEGFGYTMAEAMAYGVPVIASGYSGNLEYMAPDNSLLVPCTESFVKNAEGPFQRGSVWGEPDQAAAAELMRRVVHQPAEVQAIAARGRESVRAQLNAAAVADLLRPCFDGTAASDRAARDPILADPVARRARYL